jgi:hypothetical protein
MAPQHDQAAEKFIGSFQGQALPKTAVALTNARVEIFSTPNLPIL